MLIRILHSFLNRSINIIMDYCYNFYCSFRNFLFFTCEILSAYFFNALSFIPSIIQISILLFVILSTKFLNFLPCVLSCKSWIWLRILVFLVGEHYLRFLDEVFRAYEIVGKTLNSNLLNSVYNWPCVTLFLCGGLG